MNVVTGVARLAKSGGIAAAMIVATPTLALADPWGGVTCDQPSGECDVTAGDSGDVGASGDSADAGSSSGDDDCYYVQHTTDGQDVSDLAAAKGEGDGDWYVRRCGDEATLVWLEAPPKVSPRQVAQSAAAKLRLPGVDMGVSPDGPQLVGLPSWLWLEGGTWSDQSATASAGDVSVTAQAKPVRAQWSMGDGGTVVCDGPGTPWSATHPPEAESVDCGYTYRASSLGKPGDAFTVSVSVTWVVSWRGAGKSGSLPDMATTGSEAWTVREVHTLLTD